MKDRVLAALTGLLLAAVFILVSECADRRALDETVEMNNRFHDLHYP